MQTQTNRQVVDEHEAAKALKLSVHTLRADRCGERRIPFFKIGASVRYDLDRVWQALAECEAGGPQPRPTRRREPAAVRGSATMQTSRPPPKAKRPRATGIDSGPMDNGTLTTATLHRLWAPSAIARKAEFKVIARVRICYLFGISYERLDRVLGELLDTLPLSAKLLERDNQMPSGSYAEALEEYSNALRLFLPR